MKQTNKILKDNWYQTATPREMSIALMHLEMEVMDSMSDHYHQTYRERREKAFDELSERNGWDKEK